MSLTGGEQLTINTQERAVSTDINRLQAFRTRDQAEVFRNLYDIGQGTDDLDAGGLYQPTTTTTSPLTAEVYGGLLVQPQVGSLNLLITAGLAHCVTPQASTDNSLYEFVNDPGVSTLGSLTMTGGTGGQTRIDVIECQPQDVVIETDSRDIFNPVTGLFLATTVTKAVAAQMVYRVRPGTPGAGFPGTASGWLPLAVASVPSSATSCDSITFWDVRPLLDDRGKAQSKPKILADMTNAQTVTAAYGNHDLVEPTMGRRLGGKLRTGSTVTDNLSTVDLTAAGNQDSTISGLVTGSLYYLWLVTPFGLPRWARYTDYTTGSRLPRSPRGILVVSGNGPLSDGNINPSARPGLPSALGMGSATITAGVCVAAGYWASGAPTPFYSANGECTPERVFAAGTPNTSSFTVNMAGNVPANAVAVTLGLETDISPSGAGVFQLQVSASISPGSSVPTVLFCTADTTPSSRVWLIFRLTIPPLIPGSSSNPGTVTFTVSVNNGVGTATFATYDLSLLSWELLR